MKTKPIIFHGLNQEDIQEIILLSFGKNWPQVDRVKTEIYTRIMDEGFQGKRQLCLYADVYFTETIDAYFSLEIQSNGFIVIGNHFGSRQAIDNAIEVYRILTSKWK